MVSSDTYFAPAGRAPAEQLNDQIQAVIQAEFVATLLDAIPTIAMILNEQRQIVAVNRCLVETFDIRDPAALIGLRPGEALGCIHSSQGPGGCGTALSCSVCGAVRAILDSNEECCQASDECHIMLKDNGGTALDLEATATPLFVAQKHFTVFTLKDTSSEKRKLVMERTFFHDIINTAGGIHGLAFLLVEQADLSADKEMEYKGLLVSLSDNLIEEIKHQRSLVAAERGEFRPQLEEVDLNELLNEVCELHGHHTHLPGRNIRLEAAATSVIRTDPPILRRIIGNMLLNGLEAIPAGGSVTVRHHCSPESLRIEVSNPGEMPPDVQLKVFKRSFSSKATTGRGIGTYSMKLFGERYLGGTVGFSCADGLTTFFIELPR